MPQRSYNIRGTLSDAPPPLLTAGSKISLTGARRLIPGSARDGAGSELSVASGEVVRVELENGFVLWTRADDLVREHGQRTLSRDGGEAWEFGRVAAQRGRSGERGVVGLAIRVLDFFGVDVAAQPARLLAAALEKKQFAGHGTGFYRCSLDDTFQLSAVAANEVIPTDQGPLLVFIHGTASSTQGGFGKLWAADNAAGRQTRQELARRYGNRVFCLEHCTLTESPLKNAEDLLDRLPAKAEVHLVTHSRGGLVGESLCLGGCDNLATIITPARIQELFAADRIIAPQLGLGPLNQAAARERDADYDADRQRLERLVQQLVAKAIRVSRFVRVACPARGTTLASGRLDRWLSALEFLAERTLGLGIFSGGLDFLLAVTHERTDPRTLPGLEAMMPGSALTRLLHHPDLTTSADLTVIAGDIEGQGSDSPWHKLKVVVTDWFYGAEHDLVVNTGSMSGGLTRPDRGARFRQDQGPEVDHFSYFRNERSVRWLLAGLTRPQGQDGGFLPIVEASQAQPRWRAAVARSSSVTPPRPLSVVLPGTMGSQLQADGKPVWLDYGALFKGGLKELRMGQAGITPTGLVDEFYGPLVEFLARTHRVEVFPYDWRLSVRAAAANLAAMLGPLVAQAEKDQQPVHLVAHSMGGLVVRAMIADGGPGAALWQRITRLPNSRFLMLGTPNLGSYEAVRWLTGFNPTEAKLSLLDITESTDDIIGLVREYAGLLELLPFAPQGPDFTDPGRWQTIKEKTGAGWQTADPAALRDAATTWNLLRNAPPDPRTMRYVAGCQPATITDYWLADYDDLARINLKRLDFIATPEGDGTVTWESGRLPGVPTWYAEDTAHDALCTKTAAFPGYLDLLMTGTTTRLPDTPPTLNRDGAASARFVLPASPPTDGIPARGDLAGFGFGGGLPPGDTDDRPVAPAIQVSIRHGDLSYARHPVLVGHYLGDTVVSAEAVLDRQLGHALVRRLDLGIYPGRLDTCATFFNESATAKPAGAIVIGLGQVGELTPGLLEAGVRAALLDYALTVAHWPDDRFGKAGNPRSAAVSCLLVGSGAGGMAVHDSVEAILRGAVAANARLADAQLDAKVLIDRLEFLELFEDMAINAADALRRALANGPLAAAVRWTAEAVEPGRAGRRRVRFEEAPEWWQRVEILEEANRRDVLRFVFATDRARAEETQATGQLNLADAFIKQASGSPRANPEAAKTLFEMLLPVAVKEQAPQQTNLVLLLDERSARYPWELLEDRWGIAGRPPAVAFGLVRQLKTAVFRTRPAHAFEARALVVGNPDLTGWPDFPDLPGARQEARRVADLLATSDFDVRDCIDEKAGTIIENLHRDSWRILHLAGHGAYDYELPARPGVTSDTSAAAPRTFSGMVIGPETFLTPGDIDQMRWVPELVFVNCCHLGRTQASQDLDRGALAANLGVQFIRMGVRAVVAAGWAVDDQAGQAFAETFYRHMLDGEAFGEAVRAAREEIWSRYPAVNTWGAYQCYGDPDFRFHRNGPAPVRKPPIFRSPAELVAELGNLASALTAASADSGCSEGIGACLERIPQPQRDAWLCRADVCGALGLAWGETRDWERAIDWLEKALAADQGDCPIRVVEQCANYRVHRAAATWQAAGRTSPARREALRCQLVTAVEQAIGELDTLCRRSATVERLSLLGGAHKRLALLAAEPDRRLDALLRTGQYYRQAFEKTREAYAFTNWAWATLLARQLKPDLEIPGLATLQVDCAAVGEALTAGNEVQPNFWNSAGLADLDLVRLLAGPDGAPQTTGKSRKKSGVPKVDASAIGEAYRRAIRRGASPREVSSVAENLDFLIAMLPGGAPLSRAIQEIRKALA